MKRMTGMRLFSSQASVSVHLSLFINIKITTITIFNYVP